MVKLSTSC